MNSFCHPGAADVVGRFLGNRSLGSQSSDSDQRVRLMDRLAGDSTVIDMKLGNIYLEAKLSESDFTTASPERVERYDGLSDVFETVDLRESDGRYACYQLIRNMLAVAWNDDLTFVLLIDGRRPDLRHDWDRV
jgi:hypothetical protein